MPSDRANLGDETDTTFRNAPAPAEQWLAGLVRDEGRIIQCM